MINWDYAPYILALLAGSAIAFGLAAYAARYRALHGVLPFMGICLAIGEWMLGYALEVGSITQADKILWAKVEYLGITTAPLFWLAFALHYTGQEKRVSRAAWGLISIVPVITVLLVATNEMHGLIWHYVARIDSRPFPILDIVHGPWFWVHSATSYLWMLLGSGLLASRLREAGRLYRWQALALLLGLITPWIGNLLYVTDLGPIPHLDLTPFAFIISVLIFARALLGFRLLDLVPVARSAVMDSIGDGVLVLDEQNRVVDLNRAAGQILGITPAHAIGQAAGLVLHAHLALAERYQTVTEAQAEIVLSAGDAPRNFELHIAPLRDGTGHFAGRLITLHDITERQQAEAQIRTLNTDLEARVVARTAELEAANRAKDATLLREQAARATAEAAEQRLTFLAEASRLLAGSLDYQTTLTNLAQHAVPTLADWCAVDVQGEDGTFRRVAAVHQDPEKTALVRDLQQRYPADPQTPHGFPYVIHTGQTEFWPVVADAALSAAAENAEQLALMRALGFHSFMCVPLVARGRTLGALTLVLASPARTYGAADLALAQDLAQRAAVAVDNARLYHATQQAVHVRDEFLSIASHELKTPITSMQLAVHALLRATRQPAPPAPEYLARRLAIVDDQNRRLANLVNDLLDISRISAGRLELEPETMDLAALVGQVAEQFYDEFVQAGCALTLQAGVPVVGAWDRARIEQVITNLLTNAMKYGAGQPVIVTVTAADTLAQLIVRDHGIGIAPEQHARIFGRFERAVAPGKFRGMGLGLYITRQIVEAHGGTIGVTSAPGQGAIFTVDLPLQTAGAGNGHVPPGAD